MFCIEWSPPHVCGEMLIQLKSGTAEVWHIRLSSTGSACACKNWSMLVPMLVNADQSLPLFCPKIDWSTDHWSVDKNWPMLLLWEVADPVLALFWSRFLNMQTLKLISSAHFQLDVIIDGACMYCIPSFPIKSWWLLSPAHQLCEVMEHRPGGSGHLAQEAGLLPKIKRE